MKLQCTITFISDLQFEQVVYPQTIEIFEVYHPGAVVRILACDSYSGSDKSRFVIMYLSMVTNQNWLQGSYAVIKSHKSDN